MSYETISVSGLMRQLNVYHRSTRIANMIVISAQNDREHPQGTVIVHIGVVQCRADSPKAVILAFKRDNEKVSFPVEGFDGGSVSMLTMRVG